MTPAAHRAMRESLADYVLGRLDPIERDGVASHLADCDRCRGEIWELEQVIDTLRKAVPVRVTIDATSPVAPEPPAELEDRVVARLAGDGRSVVPGDVNTGEHIPTPIRAPRPRTSVLRWGVAVAAAIALLAAGVAVGARFGQPVPPPSEVLTFASAPAGVTANGKLIAHTWGTEVNLVITGLAAGREYRVTIVDEVGREVSGGTFIGVTGRPIVCNLNAALLREDAVRLRIVDAGGNSVLEADLTT